ncbi:hypothetical protein SODG_005914 [Sodalis praecaptivus]
MNRSLYAHIADSAARCERHGHFDEAESLWRQANAQAVQQESRDWTALRARVCEARRRFLAACPARVKNGVSHDGFPRRC